MKFIRSIKRVWTVADKEWIQIRRDARSLIIALLMPVIMILLFGYALTMDVKHVTLAILDQDRSALSRNLTDKLSHTEYIDIIRYIIQPEEADAMLNSGEAVMVLTIPSGFEKKYKTGRTPDIQLIVDGSDSTSATVAIGYIKSIVFEFNNALKLDELNKTGITGLEMPVDVRSRIWYNPELKSKNFIIPGLIALVMAIISAMITSLTVSKEWERGTMETLITTPVRRYEIYFGKMIPYVFIALFDVLLAVLSGYFLFQVPLKGSFVELFLVALLFLIGNVSLGILVSSATRSQVLSVQFSILITFLPSMILSGYVFPIRNMPVLVQGITFLIPARYLIVYMKGIALKGIGYALLWQQIVFLFVFALIVSIISLRSLSVRLPEK